MPVRVGPQAQTLPRPGRPVAPNAGLCVGELADLKVRDRALCAYLLASDSSRD
jgi:hypothetical protein